MARPALAFRSVSAEPAPAPVVRYAFARALGVGMVQIFLLNWLLARVIWLPYYFGIFFFLVAGLLTGGWSFRIARAARPLALARLLAGVAAVSLIAAASGLWWEYRTVAASVGEPPRFADARQAAVAARASVRDVERVIEKAFCDYLAANFPPGGMIGYARWAVSGGRATLTLPDGINDTIRLPQSGYAWLARTIAAYLLFAVGTWFQYEALLRATPQCNVLAPGEEAEDLD